MNQYFSFNTWVLWQFIAHVHLFFHVLDQEYVDWMLESHRIVQILYTIYMCVCIYMHTHIFIYSFLQRIESVKVLVAQLRLPLCDPMDCSLPGFSVPGILQARILEYAIPFSRGSSQTRDWTLVSYIAADSLPTESPGKTIPENWWLTSLMSNIMLQASLVAQQ